MTRVLVRDVKAHLIEKRCGIWFTWEYKQGNDPTVNHTLYEGRGKIIRDVWTGIAYQASSDDNFKRFLDVPPREPTSEERMAMFKWLSLL